MASLFDTLQAGAYRANIVPRTEKSRNWFRARVKELGTVSRQKIMSDPILKVRTEPKIGDMCMYVYDPKGKALSDKGKSVEDFFNNDELEGE